MDRTLKPGMKLLVEAEAGRPSLQVGNAFMFNPFSSGLYNVFKTAADALVREELAKTEQCRDDGMIFPILFNYRHAVELALKDLLRFGLQLGYDDAELKTIFGKDYASSGEVGGGILSRHALEPLWTQVAKMFRKYDWHLEHVNIAGGLVKELHEADPDSHTMRYDRDKKAAEADPNRFNKLPDRIDLENLRHALDCLFAYFDKLTIYIEGQLHYGKQ